MTWDWLDSARTATPEITIFVRLLLAAVLGGLIGIDREIKQRPAGLRTHMLIALAAAVFTIITFELIADGRLAGRASQADPIRVVEAVTAGVAFLAAGAIIQGRGSVTGVTTGASMWLVAALGVACGAGDYSIAIMATILTLIILAVLSRLERWIGTRRNEGPSAGSSESGS